MGTTTRNGPERRRHPRSRFLVQLEILTPQGALQGRVTNLSRGGARFIADGPVGFVGETVELAWRIGQDELRTVGEIRRTQGLLGGQLVAVAFVGFGLAEQQRLFASLLRKKVPEFRAAARVSR